MAEKTSLLTLLLCVLMALGALSSPASVGSAFADAYSAFAPLYALYKSYANFLFSGTEVLVPPDLEQACPSLRGKLSSLQIEIITQTDSQRIEQVTRVAHLRQTTDMFCQTYSHTIVSIASLPEVDLDTLKQAADDGFFVAVSDENKELERLFSSTLDTYAGSEQWRFAVAFSMRTILKQKDLVRLNLSLRDILLGPKDAPYTEGIIPSAVLPQSQELASLAGIDLDDTKRQQALSLAREVYAYLLREKN
ncbi:hypothetical protein J7K60_03425 [Candidatus Bipolaricaulota bacterium]|nr:hypothetical protein [Candidatus Bipolaricaulota bacterium]